MYVHKCFWNVLQELAVDAMSDVANSFKKIVSQSQTDSTVQTYSAAEGEMHYYSLLLYWSNTADAA